MYIVFSDLLYYIMTKRRQLILVGLQPKCPVTRVLYSLSWGFKMVFFYNNRRFVNIINVLTLSTYKADNKV